MEGIGHPWIDYYLPWNEHSMVQNWWERKTDPFPFGKAFFFTTPWKWTFWTSKSPNWNPENHLNHPPPWLWVPAGFFFPRCMMATTSLQIFAVTPTSPAKTRTTDSNLRMRGGSQRLFFLHPPTKMAQFPFKSPPKTIGKTHRRISKSK